MSAEGPPALPRLFWVSGSPPSWRVMLALEAKWIAYEGRRLHVDRGETRSPAYLAINPRGQVPTLVDGPVAVRESIAILAYLEARWPAPPLFGTTPAEAARAWQAVMEVENVLRPPAATVARVLFREEAEAREAELARAAQELRPELDRLDGALAGGGPWLAGRTFSAADCVLYPTLAWLRRALTSAGPALPATLAGLLDGRGGLGTWTAQVEALPYFARTVPPHWR